MHISFTVQPDVARAKRTLRAVMGRKFVMLYIVGALLAVAGLVMSVKGLSFGAVALALGLVALVGPLLLMRAAANAKTGLLGEPATYELTDLNVVARTPSLNNGYTWEAVKSVRETPEFWVVYVNGIGSLVLPWTEMPPPAQAEARAFLNSRGLLTA